MKLKMTAKWVESLAPESTRKEYLDTECPRLALRVTPSGVKTWSLFYRFGRQQKRLTLGTYPAVSLHVARIEAQKKRGTIQLGADPARAKQAARGARTFGELATEYLAAKQHKRSIREDRRIIDVYLNPRFEHVAAASITRSDVGSMLQAIATDAPIMANRVLALIRGIFNWAIGAGILENTPCVRLKTPGTERKRTRNLSDNEIKKVWAAFDADASVVSDLYKLRLLTLQRGKELMGMRWDEIDGQWWTIPATRTKNTREHRVWLSAFAMRILKRRQDINAKRKPRSGGPSAFVFPGKRRARPLVEPKRAFRDLREASGVANWIGKDLRRTGATAMTRDLKITRFIVGRVLNHTEDKKRDVTSHYDVYEYDSEKQDALEAWGRRITELVSDLKVVARG